MVSLFGMAIVPVTVSTSSIAFSPQQVGTTSGAEKLTVTNNSSSAVAVSSIVHSVDFTETNTCDKKIAAGKSCTVSISFAPTRGGFVLGSVIITDSATGSPQIVDLSGNGYLVPGFAYVANKYEGTVSSYTVNPKTGQLRSNGYELAGESPQQVTVDPSGRFAYVANQGSNSISAYTINASTGALTPTKGSPFDTESGPVSLAVDPSGKFVYAANNGAGKISAYAIDGDNGALTSVSGSPFSAGEEPNSVTVSPSGKFVYMTNEGSADISAYAIDAATGALTTVAGSPFAFHSSDGGRPTAVAVNPAGTFLFVTSNNDSDVAAFSINAANGALTQVAGSPFPVTDDCASLTIAPSGNVAYIASGFGSSSFSVFAIGASGVLTPVAGSPFSAGSNVNSVTLNPQGNILYVTNSGSSGVSQPNSNEVWIYTINSSTGVPTLLSKIRIQQGPTSLALGGGTTGVTYTPTFAYVANQGSNTVASTISAYAINAGSGKITAISGSPFPDGKAGTFAFASSIAVDPSGTFAYVANAGTNNVSAYSIKSSTGALAAINCSTCSLGAAPTAVTVDLSGRFVYVANGGSGNPNTPSVSAYTIDAGTGALTPVSGSPYATGGADTESVSVTVDPTGQFLYVASISTQAAFGNISAFIINNSTGALTAVSGSPFAIGVNQPGSVAVDPSGRFAYVANENAISSSYVMSSFAIDATLGALTFLSYSSPVSASNLSVPTDPLGHFVYTTRPAVNDVAGLSTDSTTGALTVLTDSPFADGETSPLSIAIDPWQILLRGECWGK